MTDKLPRIRAAEAVWRLKRPDSGVSLRNGLINIMAFPKIILLYIKEME